MADGTKKAYRQRGIFALAIRYTPISSWTVLSYHAEFFRGNGRRVSSRLHHVELFKEAAADLQG